MRRLFLFLFILAVGCDENPTYIVTDLNVKLDTPSTETNYIPGQETLLNPRYETGKLSGLGIFRIGSSISLIAALSENGYKVDSISTARQQIDYRATRLTGEGKAIVRILHAISARDTDEEIAQANWCQGSKVYWLPSYHLYSLELKDVYLTFYKNKLVRVSCAFSEALYEAIEAKYGEANNIKGVSSGNSTPHRIWWNQDLSGGYSSADKSFFVEVSGASNFMRDCSRKGLEAAYLKEKQSLREKYKDL
jgi:hypothetical protein